MINILFMIVIRLKMKSKPLLERHFSFKDGLKHNFIEMLN